MLYKKILLLVWKITECLVFVYIVYLFGNGFKSVYMLWMLDEQKYVPVLKFLM